MSGRPLERAAPAPRSETLARTDRALLYCFLAIRAVHLAQGAICVVSGRDAYRSRKRAAAVLAGAGLESVWLAQRGLRRGALDRQDATVDACAGVVGLTALAGCLAPEDRTASMNWMLPYSVGGSLAMGVALPVQAGFGATIGMAATYLASVQDSVRSGGTSAAVAAANAASYVGFYGVSRLIVSVIEHNGREIDAARAEAIERGERLAAERERNRQHRMVHDTALQVLEAISRDWLDGDTARSQAAAAARDIRRALRGEDVSARPGSLVAGLEELTIDLAARGLSVELVIGTVVREPPAASAGSLVDAAREALTNVVKHAGVSQAVVHVGVEGDRATVTIRDHGCGFDPSATTSGFGLPESVTARMADIGGKADVWSAPGRGTRVELSAPA